MCVHIYIRHNIQYEIVKSGFGNIFVYYKVTKTSISEQEDDLCHIHMYFIRTTQSVTFQTGIRENRYLHTYHYPSVRNRDTVSIYYLWRYVEK